MKNLGWYIIAIIMGLLTLSVTITENSPETISIFGYVGIFHDNFRCMGDFERDIT